MPKEKTKFVWWTEAEAAFADYFGPLKEDDLADALEKWCELDAKEHRFYEAKLAYLLLRSNVTLARLNQQVLEEMRQINADADGGDDDEAAPPAPAPRPARPAGPPPRRPAGAAAPDQPTGSEPTPRRRAPSEPSPDAPDNNGMGGELVEEPEA